MPVLRRAINILLAEDSEADAQLAIEIFKDCVTPNVIYVVEDGELALDFLYKRGAYKDAVRPDLILLDINMPKKDGFDVLKVVKTDLKLLRIPVIMLTSSKSEEDITRSYSFYANSYVPKPIDLDRFIEVVQNIERYWFGINELPIISDD